MKIIADTNIFLSVALEEESKGEIVALTQGCDIYAPEILPYEIGNAISAMVKRKKIDRADAVSIFSITQKIPVKLVKVCLLYTSPSPRDLSTSRMPSSA